MLNIKFAKNTTVELDADSLVYRIGSAVDLMEKGKESACRLLDDCISNIYEDTECARCNIYLGTSSNFRNDIATLMGYKANRTGKNRPFFYDAIRYRMVNEYGAKLVYNQEAEDTVGIEAYTYDNFDNFIVGAIDKDMDMIAGYRYNYAKRTINFIDKYQALRSFYTQLVTGDKSVDNIPGLYHQLLLDGEDELAHKFRYSRYKKKLIAELEPKTWEKDMWESVFNIYKQYGQVKKHGLNNLIEVGRLLWIRRFPGELWVPPIQRDFDYINNDKREKR